MQESLLSPEDFKGAYKRKGWTGITLAVRWDKSTAWISKLGKGNMGKDNDGNPVVRGIHWDDSVRGLPEFNESNATQATRLTPHEFKSLYRSKGWNGTKLAQRWSKSEARISVIGNDPNRDPHWDDAVRGLPIRQASIETAYVRLSPEQFKDQFRNKGWSVRKLSMRWGESEAEIYKIAKDQKRKIFWDDAVLGLPEFKKD